MIKKKSRWWVINFKKRKSDAIQDGLLVILTVPHSECIEFPEYLCEDGVHSCDYVALPCAKRLATSLQDLGIEIIIIPGNINRREIDLNRKEGRGTAFHKKLDDTIAKKGNETKILLDIHSGCFRDATLLILKSVRFLELELLNSIQNKTNSIIVVGSEKNYIMSKAIDRGVPALLLEFNESVEYFSDFFDKLAKAVQNWYNKKIS